MTFKECVRGLLSCAQAAKRQKTKLDFKPHELAFLVPHAKKNASRVLGLFCLLILGSALSLPGPAITGLIIDKIFIRKDAAKLNLYVGVLLAILLLSEIVKTFQEYCTIRLSQEFKFSIKSHLLERILKYPLSFFNDFQTGYVISRLDEVNLLGSFFSSTIPVLAENTLRFVGAIFLISRYDVNLTLVALPALPLFFEVSRRSVGMIRTTSLGTMETSAKVRGKIQDTLSGIEVVKTFGKEGRETAAIKGGLRSMIEVETLQNLFSSISGRILAVITGLNLLLILWFGGHEIIAGRLSVGQYTAFVAYLGYLYSPIQLFAITFIQLQRTMMACKRISSFLDRTAEDENPARTHDPMTLRGAICFDKVHYSFGNGKDVLRDVSFDIRGGEKVAFVGKSGAGKSTLVHLALGLYEPTSGRIEIDGFDLKTIKLDSLRKRIGIVSQNVLLFDDSLLNNIKYSRPEASLAEVIAAAKASGCHDFISRFPEGYNTRAGEIGKRLSGGEKQRISVARCLLKMPDVVILDEPTAHLDPLAAKDVIDSIQELFKDKTCIIISHNLNNIHWADRVYVLEDGRLVQEGRHEDLVRIAGCYRELTDASMAVSARLVS